VSSSDTDTGANVYCAAHPGTVTYLRCAQCNTPICPRCLVMTPVGAKCAKCARGRLQPAFRMSPVDVVVAWATCLLGGLVLGVVGSIVTRLIHFVGGLVVVLFPIATGILLADLIPRVVPRKHGLILKLAAAAGVVVAFVTIGLGDFVWLGPAELARSGMLPVLLHNWLVSLVINPFNVLFVALGVWVAISRVD